jgi:hypothetical protein
MLLRPSRFVVVACLAAGIGPPAAGAQPPAQIVIGATVPQRQEAARAIVPLLKDVKAHAQPGITVKPGGAPNSPFAGTQTTLFSFTLSRRSVPVDPRVVAAMNRLLDWNVGAAGREEEARLFDRLLVELQSRSTAAMSLTGGGVCDLNCVVTRVTTLNEAWGPSPRGRADARDELLLDALTAAVLAEPR